MVGEQELAKRFRYHAPKGDQAIRYEMIRDHAHNLAAFIDEKCPDSREKSLAMTALEESVMWANAAIARNELWPGCCCWAGAIPTGRNPGGPGT